MVLVLVFSHFQVKVVSEPERIDVIDVFLTRSCVQVTDIFCGAVYKATLADLVYLVGYRSVLKWNEVTRARDAGDARDPSWL